MPILKQDESKRSSRRVGSKKKSMEIAVTYRRQTLEEERKMKAVIRILLAEIVRQKMSCMENL